MGQQRRLLASADLPTAIDHNIDVRALTVWGAITGSFQMMMETGNQSIRIIGPAIIARGSAAQKQHYLGPMLRAEEGWCQLFSEPAAGSDLAAVQTRAQRTGDGFELTG